MAMKSSWNKWLDRHCKARYLAFALIIGLILYSCASVGRIEGGPYDEEPPVFLSSTPVQGALNANRSKISLVFNEFLKLEKASEKVVISPPQVNMPEITASGKKVIIKLQDTLKANTTYTFDFGDAIQDNNEGNPLENFQYSFSTGSILDTMAVSGFLLNAKDLEPVKGAVVGLYANMDDSVFTTLPFDRVGKTDSRGRFSIKGIAPGSYRIFALQDADQNYYFSQPGEVIAFGDSIITPHFERRIRRDTTWIDTLTIDTITVRDYTHYLPDDIVLRCFKEDVWNQRLSKMERLKPNKFTLYFTAPMDSLPMMEGLNFEARDAFIVEQPTGRIDTLHYWIRDSLLFQQDTLRMVLTYDKMDSLNRRLPFNDTVRIVSKTPYKKLMEREAEEKEKAEKAAAKKRKKGEEVKPKEDYLSVEIYAPQSMDVYEFISIKFTEPVESVDTSMIHIRQKIDTLWSDVPYDFERDSMSIMTYNIIPREDWITGGEYTFEMDSLACVNIYGKCTNRQKRNFKVKKLEEYGQIFFDISGVDTTAFVELLDEQDKVLRTVTVENDRADFYFLNPGKYGARLIIDRNNNGMWDTGKYAEHLQAEEVYYYWQLINLKANFDITQTWNIHERAAHAQKPSELKKQKPDDERKKRERNNSRNNNRNNNSSSNRSLRR